MLGLNRSIRDRRNSGRSSGRADGRDVLVDSMLWQTSGKSARHDGELVVPEPLYAGRQHLPFYDRQWQFTAQNLVPVGAGSS